MTFAENVPVKINGEQVGRATITEDGGVTITMKPTEAGKAILDTIVQGFTFGLSLSPIVNPAVDGNLITRLDNEPDIAAAKKFREDNGWFKAED